MRGKFKDVLAGEETGRENKITTDSMMEWYFDSRRCDAGKRASTTKKFLFGGCSTATVLSSFMVLASKLLSSERGVEALAHITD
jgi:hypothetical protein